MEIDMRKNRVRNGAEYLGILLGSILLGTLLLIGVYALPAAPMKANVQRSTEIYDYEGVYPQLMWGYKLSQLDNCTDATMLLAAAYMGEQSAVERAMQVYRTEYKEEHQVKSLTHYANDVVGETYTIAYPRYWHGYLVILKPLLLFFDVADIRLMNMVLQLALLFYIFYLMLQKGQGRYVPAFLTMIFLLNPIAIALSFQFSTVYYLMLFSVIFVLKRDKLAEKEMLCFFLIVGILTAYFDFLTYPLVALYVPMIFLVLREDSWKKALRLVFWGSVMWGLGYGGMWCGKWVVGSLLLHKNLFEDVFSRAAHYESMDYGEGKISGLQVLLKNVMVLVKWPVLFGGLGLAGYYAGKLKKKLQSGQKLEFPVVFLLILIALIPFAWYFLSGSHSYIHYWYTYRELGITVFALLAGMTRLTILHGEKADEKTDTSH